MTNGWVVISILVFITVVGFSTYCWAHHDERKQWLLRRVEVGRYFTTRSCNATIPRLTVFDVLYDLVRIEPKMYGPVSRLRFDQAFEDVDELLQSLHREAGLRSPTGAEIKQRINAIDSVSASPYVTAECAVLRAGLAADGADRDRMVEDFCIAIAEQFGRPVASEAVLYLVQSFVPSDHPLVAEGIRQGCFKLIDWLFGVWKQRHLRRAMEELRERGGQLVAAFLMRYRALLSKATFQHWHQLNTLRSTFRVAEPWIERTLRPSLGAKFLAMAIARTKQETRQIEKYYGALRSACASAGQVADKRVAVACSLYEEGEAILLGDVELLNARRAMQPVLLQVNAERARLGKSEIVRV